MRLKLIQGVLLNYQIVGRDSYVNKIDTKPPVAFCNLKAGGQHVFEMDYKGRRKECKAH